MKHYQKMVQPVLGAAGIQHTLHVTERAGHATELAARMDLTNCDAIVFMGGDGTVHESLQVRSRMHSHDKQLGVAASVSMHWVTCDRTQLDGYIASHCHGKLMQPSNLQPVISYHV